MRAYTLRQAFLLVSKLSVRGWLSCTEFGKEFKNRPLRVR